MLHRPAASFGYPLRVKSALRIRRRLAGAALGAVRCGLAALLFGPVSSGSGTAAPQSPSLPGMVRVTIEVELSCPSCAAGLERRLLRLDHVAGVEVSSPAGRVVLAVAPGRHLDLAAVWDTVRNAGFIPDRLAVTAVGHLTDVNGVPALALSPDFALPLAAADGVTAPATEMGARLMKVTGHWRAPPDGAGRLQVESFEVR